MSQSFTAQIRGWTEKAKRNTTLVLADAAQGVFQDMSRRQPGVKETGGSFVVGAIPVDTGLLANSMFTTLDDTLVAQGSEGYVAALEGFEGGQTILHAFSQDYALDIEYGTQHFEGRFMVREAINGAGGWQARVDASAAKFVD